MKYLVLLCDGMADYKLAELSDKTPMEKAKKPTMDLLAKDSLCGTVLNVPEGMVPESDTANMAILSFDPKIYSKGRSPLEAVSMGIAMQPEETIASPDASPSSPSIRLNALMITITQMNWNRRDR